MGEDVLSVFEHAIKVLSCKDDLVDSRYVVSEYPLFPFCSSSYKCSNSMGYTCIMHTNFFSFF
jgi:hypothetical protein